ncbi:hypothetical protein RHECIAT_CH0003088 [Rhizobium etli CIAT 652]|uniref:Uncharacterized protein n=1 Tax=Rhizobium etli (strain CIAT 652) TaxID=491916 RepID=B3PUF5_RHIE6|nr:hypothetical protein RHECIAT_CH0003088 [Rhizobium etli CIAT 652]
MKKNEAFEVPSLADVDPLYRDLTNRLSLLLEKQSALRAESDAIEADLGKQSAAPYSANVAALLGEDTGADTVSGKRQRLREIPKEERDVEIAIAVVKRRIEGQKPIANSLVLDRSRAEYGKRVADVIDALRTVKAARAAYIDLVDGFEREDIAWTSLDPMSLGFLGDPKDGQIERVTAEARRAGYVD